MSAEWIKCSDRLPDSRRGFILAYFPNVPEPFSKIDSIFWDKYGSIEGYARDHMKDCDEDDYHEYLFTHWMPLPEPPKVTQ